MPQAIAGIGAALGRGDCLVAYDLAMRAAASDPTDVEARYLAVLALARAGATERAAEQLAAFGLDEPRTDLGPAALVEDLGALRARLAKDRALASTGETRTTWARVAAERYEAIYSALARPFSGINAATMWLLAGDADRSRRLASEVLGLVRAATDAHGEDAYWNDASAAEAYLLLGDVDAARAALVHAAAHDGTIGSRATTRRQLTLLCELTGSDVSVLDALALPLVIHFTGHMAMRYDANEEERIRREIDAWLAARDVGFGFGALACGADIIVAEALLARGAELHVVFPCARDDFVEVSVGPGGETWRSRFDRCEAAATSISFATEGPYFDAPDLFAHGAAVAMGKALLRASYLATESEQLAIWDGAPADGVAGTGRDVETWSAAGGHTHVISVARTNGSGTSGARSPSVRTVRALIFADVEGFGRLSEAQIPEFVTRVLEPLGRAVDSLGAAVLHRNTWGDGIYLVLDDVRAAARCALALQEQMEALDLPAAGLPALALRVGAHAGPVFEQRDPVTGRPNFFGVEVVRAARIEPGTPPGDVYVTDPFAALVALTAAGECSCQYVGPVPAAKDYGTLPLYTLRRRGGPD